jgi:hypothetical protein
MKRSWLWMALLGLASAVLVVAALEHPFEDRDDERSVVGEPRHLALQSRSGSTAPQESREEAPRLPEVPLDGLERMAAAGFRPSRDEDLHRLPEPRGHLEVPNLRSKGGRYLAEVDREEVLAQVDRLHQLLGAAKAEMLYARCSFEDAQAADRVACELSFEDLRRSWTREQAEAIDAARGQICASLGGLRGRLANFADVTEREMKGEPGLLADMQRMTRGVRLVELFCESR